jgi:hypothetical protein
MSELRLRFAPDKPAWANRTAAAALIRNNELKLPVDPDGRARRRVTVRPKLLTLAGVKPISLEVLPPANSRMQRAMRRRTSERASTASDADTRSI